MNKRQSLKVMDPIINVTFPLLQPKQHIMHAYKATEVRLEMTVSFFLFRDWFLKHSIVLIQIEHLFSQSWSHCKMCNLKSTSCMPIFYTVMHRHLLNEKLVLKQMHSVHLRSENCQAFWLLQLCTTVTTVCELWRCFLKQNTASHHVQIPKEKVFCICL